jgi:DNA mismatch endonuclease (patch repair protein)
MDTVSPQWRPEIMARVRAKDTVPEMVIRRLVHGMGYRYRLHRRDLPGTPDLVFVGRRKVIFVHGCFWHRHTGWLRLEYQKLGKSFG